MSPLQLNISTDCDLSADDLLDFFDRNRHILLGIEYVGISRQYFADSGSVRLAQFCCEVDFADAGFDTFPQRFV